MGASRARRGGEISSSLGTASLRGESGIETGQIMGSGEIHSSEEEVQDSVNTVCEGFELARIDLVLQQEQKSYSSSIINRGRYGPLRFGQDIF